MTERARKLHHQRVKTPLILVPGLLCDWEVWAAQRAALQGIADIQIAEHSQSDSLGALAESIIARAPPQFAIAGHSMGGRIALEVMRRVPARVRGMALLDTGYEPLAAGQAGEHEAAGRHALLAVARTAGMRAMIRQWVQGMVHPARLQDEDLIHGIVEMMARHTPDLYAAQIHALLNRPDAQTVLQSIRVPSLALCGREDLSAPPSRHSAIAAMIPGCQLSIIPDCGHMAPLERPEAVSAALRGWLSSIG